MECCDSVAFSWNVSYAILHLFFVIYIRISVFVTALHGCATKLTVSPKSSFPFDLPIKVVLMRNFCKASPNPSQSPGLVEAHGAAISNNCKKWRDGVEYLFEKTRLEIGSYRYRNDKGMFIVRLALRVPLFKLFRHKWNVNVHLQSKPRKIVLRQLLMRLRASLRARRCCC